MRYSFLTILLGVAACDAPEGHGGEDARPTSALPDADTVAPTPDAASTMPDGATGTTPHDAVGDRDAADDLPLGPSDPRAPVILALSTSVARITAGERVTFSAIVTDPDGIDDLIGGRLRDPGLDVAYGAFATAASEGAYALSLTWEDLHSTIAIAFEGGEQERVFVAEFFDQAGHVTTGALRLTLHCDGAPACDGACAALACEGSCLSVASLEHDQEHCGACDVACPDRASCSYGMCVCPARMVVCDDDCADLASDGDDCGACGVECPSGQCRDGRCECSDLAACPGSQTCMGYGSHWHVCGELGAVHIGTSEAPTIGKVAIDLDGETIDVCGSSSGVASVACRETMGDDWRGYELARITIPTSSLIAFACEGDEAALRHCSATLGGCNALLHVECIPDVLPPVQHLAVDDYVAKGESDLYAVTFPAARPIVIAANTMSDVDLYMSFDRPVTRTDYDVAARTEGGEDLIYRAERAGTLNILVYGSEAAAYTLETSDP